MAESCNDATRYPRLISKLNSITHGTEKLRVDILTFYDKKHVIVMPYMK